MPTNPVAALLYQIAVFAYTTLVKNERVSERVLMTGIEWLWTSATGRTTSAQGLRGFILQGLQDGEFILVGPKGEELQLTEKGRVAARAFACARHKLSAPCHECHAESHGVEVTAAHRRALQRHDGHVILGMSYGVKGGEGTYVSFDPRSHCPGPSCQALRVSKEKLQESAKALREETGTASWATIGAVLRMILWDPDACAQPDKAEERAVAQLEDGTYSGSDRAEIADLVLSAAEVKKEFDFEPTHTAPKRKILTDEDRARRLGIAQPNKREALNAEVKRVEEMQVCPKCKKPAKSTVSGWKASARPDGFVFICGDCFDAERRAKADALKVVKRVRAPLKVGDSTLVGLIDRDPTKWPKERGNCCGISGVGPCRNMSTENVREAARRWPELAEGADMDVLEDGTVRVVDERLPFEWRASHRCAGCGYFEDAALQPRRTLKAEVTLDTVPEIALGFSQPVRCEEHNNLECPVCPAPRGTLKIETVKDGEVVKKEVHPNEVIVCGAPDRPVEAQAYVGDGGASLPKVCPKCGTKTESGYGLAGGGMGPYVACTKDGCDYFAKQREPQEPPCPLGCPGDPSIGCDHCYPRKPKAEPFKCPRCARVSHNPSDRENGWCGACNAHTAKWERCTPALLASGVSCALTPRRPGTSEAATTGIGPHDHLVSIDCAVCGEPQWTPTSHACCPEGLRYERETGEAASSHPGPCIFASKEEEDARIKHLGESGIVRLEKHELLGTITRLSAPAQTVLECRKCGLEVIETTRELNDDAPKVYYVELPFGKTAPVTTCTGKRG